MASNAAALSTDRAHSGAATRAVVVAAPSANAASQNRAATGGNENRTGDASDVDATVSTARRAAPANASAALTRRNPNPEPSSAAATHASTAAVSAMSTARANGSNRHRGRDASTVPSRAW